MIEVLSGAQVAFNPFSQIDQRLKGEVVLRNPNSERYTVFKIKSTDSSAFEAVPSKGIINPRDTAVIKIHTTRTVDAQYAKTLSQKHKFLIQYAMLSSKPMLVDDATSQLRGSTAQNIKIYINTSSVRGSHLGKSNKDTSIVGTNRYSFHSMGQNGQNSRPTPNQLNIEQPNDEVNRLNCEIESLQKQRARVSKDAEGKGRDNKKGGMLKYVIIFGLGLIAGNLASHYTGINSFMKEKVGKLTKPEVKKQQEGFFSIFNFGEDDTEKVVKSEMSWWNIL